MLELRNFYFDRVWVKAYPAFFSDIRFNIESWEKYQEYRRHGVFERWTVAAFRLYRTLDLIKKALKLGVPLEHAWERRRDIRRFGEDDYYEFDVADSGVKIRACEGVYKVSLGLIRSVRFIAYPVVAGDRVRYEKSVYFEMYPWLRVMVKPYLDGYRPPMIRLFYNPLLRAKAELGLGDFGLEAQHDNFVDPEALGEKYEEFLALNYKYAFDRGLRDVAEKLWSVWFCGSEALRVKVTQVEFAYDSVLPKLDLVKAAFVLGGRSKTLKSSVDGVKYSWTDAGVKYYVTIRRGFQVKIYTKAWSQHRVLNRLEYTFKLDRDLDVVDIYDVYANEDLVSTHMQILKVLMDKELRAKIEELLRPVVRCRRNCEAHYAFWLDILTTGQVRGSSYYSGVVKVYKRLGLVKVKGRGRNSVYTLNEDMLAVAENLRKLFGLTFEELTYRRIRIEE